MKNFSESLVQAGMADKVITDSVLKILLNGTPASRYALINKAIKRNEVIHLKRGAYLFNHPLYNTAITSQFFIACQLMPHSYISFESALSYHQWIPEKVNTITCGLLSGRNKIYNTPLGQFEYAKIITNEYEKLTGVQREIINSKPILIASPVRAFFDLVYEKKIPWQGISYLTDSLRIEPENLSTFTLESLEQMKSVYHQKKVNEFITQLKKALYS